MHCRLAVLFLISFAVSGCDLVKAMAPRNATTQEAARYALTKCGIDPDAIAWSVDEDGLFAFGRKSPDAEAMSVTQSDCIMRWVQDERVKFAFIGWEHTAP